MSNIIPTTTDNREKDRAALSGWLMLLVNFALLLGGVALFVQQIALGDRFAAKAKSRPW